MPPRQLTDRQRRMALPPEGRTIFKLLSHISKESIDQFVVYLVRLIEDDPRLDDDDLCREFLKHFLPISRHRRLKLPRLKKLLESREERGVPLIEAEEWEEPAEYAHALSKESRLMLDGLLQRISSWTYSNWEQHLRFEHGDEKTDRLLVELGYEHTAGAMPKLKLTAKEEKEHVGAAGGEDSEVRGGQPADESLADAGGGAVPHF